MTDAFILRSPIVSTDTTLRRLRRDPVMEDDNDGVRFLFDLAFPYCWPGGSRATRPAPGAPADGAIVHDAADNANGAARMATSNVTFSGNGWDFSAAGQSGHYLEAPASVAADLWSTIGGKTQLWSVTMWCLFPTLSSWELANTYYWPLFHAAGTSSIPAGYYITTPDIVHVGVQPNGNMRCQVQTAVGTVTQLVFSAGEAAKHYGRVTQIVAWRSSGGIGCRVKSAGGTSTVISVLNAANTSNYSSQKFRFGISQSLYPSSGMTYSDNWKIFRGFIENLARSGRDPLAVADADYAATLARSVFT